MGMAEFFAMEAGDYLERLDAIVSPAGPPNVEEFVRLARALRGSALMANQQPIAAAAAGLEALARAVRETRVPWDPATKQIAVRAVDDLKILIRAVTSWSPREDAKARAVAQELEQRAGVRASARISVAGGDTGTRAFVAREGAAVASALDRAAITLTQNPTATDQVHAVLKAMQPLRGLAGLTDLPPLSDLLEGIQRAVAELTRRKDAAADAAQVLQAAARALARAAREATAGPLSADSPELADFAAKLGHLTGADRDVVPVESLYFDDPGPHVVLQGTAPGTARAVPQVELVAHGEHLKQVADGLERAASGAQRELQLQSLTDTVSALSAAGLAAFANAVRDAVVRGSALRDPTTFAARLREAGTLLGTAAPGTQSALAGQLERVAAALRVTAASTAKPGVPAVARTPPAPPPGDGEEAPTLIGSLLRFHRLLETVGQRPASLDQLLAGPPVLPAAAAPATAADGGVVPIEHLCYAGPAALERALSLRDDVRAALSKGDGGQHVSALLEEIFDLVKLAQRAN